MNNIKLKRTTNSDPDFQTLVIALDADLRNRYGEIMDVYDIHNVIEQLDTVVIAYLENIAVGCGCFKGYDTESVEMKRIFVRADARGKGISTLILNELEDWARELGFMNAVLETGSKQKEAIGLYQKNGYKEIPKYEPYVDLPDSICFRKEFSA